MNSLGNVAAAEALAFKTANSLGSCRRTDVHNLFVTADRPRRAKKNLFTVPVNESNFKTVTRRAAEGSRLSLFLIPSLLVFCRSADPRCPCYFSILFQGMLACDHGNWPRQYISRERLRQKEVLDRERPGWFLM